MRWNDRSGWSPEEAAASYAAFMDDVNAGRVEDWDTKHKPRSTALLIRGRVAATIRRLGPGEWAWDEVLGDQGSDGYLPTYEEALDDALTALGAGKCTVAQWEQWYED